MPFPKKDIKIRKKKASQKNIINNIRRKTNKHKSEATSEHILSNIHHDFLVDSLQTMSEKPVPPRISRKNIIENLRRKTDRTYEETSTNGTKNEESQNWIYHLICVLLCGTLIFIFPAMIVNSFTSARSLFRKTPLQTPPPSSFVHIIPPGMKSNMKLLTFASMLRARKYASVYGIKVDFVFNELIYPQVRNFDFDYVDGASRNLLLRCASNISNPILNMPCIPLISDVLQSAYNHSKAGIVIFTNIDIAVYEDFYFKIDQAMKQRSSMYIIPNEVVRNMRKYGNIYNAGHLDDLYRLNETSPYNTGEEAYIWRKEKFTKEDVDLETMIFTPKFWTGALKYILSSKGNMIRKESSRGLIWHVDHLPLPASRDTTERINTCWNAINQARILGRVNEKYPLSRKFHEGSGQYEQHTSLLYSKWIKKFQCDRLSPMWDDFPDMLSAPAGWMQSVRSELSCEWCEDQTKRTCAPPIWEEMDQVHAVIPWQPCRGGTCEEKDVGYRSFKFAWETCQRRNECRVILRDPNGQYRLRRRSPHSWQSRVSLSSWSYVYYECKPPSELEQIKAKLTQTLMQKMQVTAHQIKTKLTEPSSEA